MDGHDLLRELHFLWRGGTNVMVITFRPVKLNNVISTGGIMVFRRHMIIHTKCQMNLYFLMKKFIKNM